MKSRKRKLESEPVLPQKKVRFQKRVCFSEHDKRQSNTSLDSYWSLDYTPITSSFSQNYSSQDEPDVQIPTETPDYINKLASQVEFAEYEFGKVLGAGGFGQVMSATRIKDNLPVALKFVHKKTVKEFKEINGREIPAEAYLQRRAQNSNVINIYEVIDTNEYFVYVMERPESCKDMFDIIAERYDQNKTLTEREVRRYFTQILQANIGCEENGVLHRDIKPENILVDMSSDVAKLIDFGLASEVQQEPFRKFRGTRSYMPPEFTQSEQYDGCQGTVWQMGILLVDMLSPDMSAFEHPDHAVSMPPRVPQHLSPELKNLVCSLLNTNPDNRPTLKQALQHPWFSMKN